MNINVYRDTYTKEILSQILSEYIFIFLWGGVSLHRSVLALPAPLRKRVASFPAVELRARGTGLYWFSKGGLYCR